MKPGRPGELRRNLRAMVRSWQIRQVDDAIPIVGLTKGEL